MPLRCFLDNDRDRYSYEDIEWRDGLTLRLHIFKHGRFTIWGLTARVLIRVAMIAFAVENPPFEIRPAEQRRTSIEQTKEEMQRMKL
jgi:hypothetical protein